MTALMKAVRSAFSLGFVGLGTIGPAGLGSEDHWSLVKDHWPLGSEGLRTIGP